MIIRRELLKKASAATFLTLGPGLPVWSQPSSAPPRSALFWFTNLSSILLGIEEKHLRPAMPQDGLSLADVYYGICAVAFKDKFESDVRAGYEDLIIKAQHTHTEIINWALIDSKSGKGPRVDVIGSASRLIMLLWLYGVWYGGNEIEVNKELDLNSGFKENFVVSSRAYKDAWIWRIAQAHAMGYSHFNFGSWAELPPTLSDYGISLT